MNTIEKKLSALYQRWSGVQPDSITAIKQSGSYRQYFRLSNGHKTAIGAYYDQIAENSAFISFSRHFADFDLNVPEIYEVDEDLTSYLMEDLGDKILFDHVKQLRQQEGFGEKSIKLYQQILDELIQFQMIAGKSVDYSVCYPSQQFGEQAYLWDLNYFKYNFLKLVNIPFDEFKLENDFRQMVQKLLSADHSFFVYRDFQTRNIMQRGDELCFIDYQGGRKGALHYDVASLLFQARAEIPFEIREQLLDYYIAQAAKIEPESAADFRMRYYDFVLVRVLQTLGAYGFRGLYEKKQPFIETIPLALNNIRWLLDNNKIPANLPEITKSLELVLKSNQLQTLIKPPLKLKINSFSYKRGIPPDLSGNGEGFVFDCRALPNPGRYAEYAHLTGLDQPVKEYLEKYPEVENFIHCAYQMVKSAVDVYSSRGFTDLMVSFGCTGGQHRSVYCAEQLAKKFAAADGVHTLLRHCEQE